MSNGRQRPECPPSRAHHDGFFTQGAGTLHWPAWRKGRVQRSILWQQVGVLHSPGCPACRWQWGVLSHSESTAITSRYS